MIIAQFHRMAYLVVKNKVFSIPFVVLLLLMINYKVSAQVLNPPVHDPVMIKQDTIYYLFCTGRNISTWSSKDMISWKREKPVFDTAPSWAVKAVPGFVDHIWAPDISFHDGKYYLYYSISTFGKNNSCIGLATNSTLHPNDKNYKWIDHGKIVQSIPGRDLWNAIDPNIIRDGNNAWLSFGSWWSGIKMVKLTADQEALSQPEEWYSIARRARDYSTNDLSSGSAAIEAPFIFKKGKYYYLFVSFDVCCKGPQSTYKIAVGRSGNIKGPYIDKDGMEMNKGGGSIVLQGDKDWYGVGHNSVYTFDGKDYLVFHGYDAADRGRSKLRVLGLNWDTDGWPGTK